MRESRDDRSEEKRAGTDAADRRCFLMRLTSFGVASSLVYSRPAIAGTQVGGGLSPTTLTLQTTGTGTIDSDCGIAVYSFTGLISYIVDGNTITLTSIEGDGTRISGHDLGPIHLASDGISTGTVDLSGNLDIQGNLTYTDDFNSSLTILVSWTGTLDPAGMIASLEGSASAEGSCDVGTAAVVFPKITW